MIVALVILAVGLAGGGPLSILFLLRYLAGRDQRDRDERAELANRLQHPQVYQPTPGQRADLQQERELPRDEFELAGKIIAGSALDEINGGFSAINEVP